jgi:Cd2+/Zn2+-exporting ATPase/Cu+-exporting ATPase
MVDITKQQGPLDAAPRAIVHVPTSDEAPDHDHSFKWQEAARITFVVIAAAAVWFEIWEPVSTVSVIGVIGLLVGGWPILEEAFENLLARRMTMELSMTIAIVAAAAIGEFFTALIITLFVLVAEVLEGMTVSRGRHAIHDLVHFLPQAVSVRRPDGVREIHVDELQVGDAVLVNPGGRVPVDGTVLNGHSFLDQSRITGESMPVEKTAGSLVFAGSINQSGAIEVRADRIGRDTSYGKIIETIETAERSRAPVQRLADRMAGYLVYFALGAAALTYFITRDIRSTISVVIVAGACGIAAGTPLAILGAIGRAARLGAIIKGGLYLETLGHVDTVVVDKTGTLTYGHPELQKVIPADGIAIEAVLDAAATAELRSEHPLGQAIVAYAKSRGRSIPEPDSFDYTPGRGISASSAGSIILVGNRALLTEHGIAAVAPLEHKRLRVKELVGQGRLVAMLGDGVNDAPALTEANVGVAMGCGTDVARESADVVLLGNDLVRFVEVLAIARRTRHIIWQNFTGTIAVDTVGIALASVGLLNPLLAAFIHVASELVFILNSARLLPASDGSAGGAPLPAPAPEQARPA